jgi:predicted GIY-YIG superfamily endonuclease
MAWVYILRGSTGRHYIASAVHLERRLTEHRNGGTHTRNDCARTLETIAVLELETKPKLALERQLKRKMNPAKYKKRKNSKKSLKITI